MFPHPARRAAIAIACALLAAVPLTAHAADFASSSWVADATVADPLSGGNGLFGDGGGTYVYGEGGLTRVTDDTQGDFFMFSPRQGRTTNLVVGSQQWSCSGGNNVYVHTPGADWFPNGSGMSGLSGYVYCYQHADHQQVRAIYDACLEVTRVAAGHWRAAAPAGCTADVRSEQTVKGKTTYGTIATDVEVPFDVTACLRGTLKQYRNGAAPPCP